MIKQQSTPLKKAVYENKESNRSAKNPEY